MTFWKLLLPVIIPIVQGFVLVPSRNYTGFPSLPAQFGQPWLDNEIVSLPLLFVGRLCQEIAPVSPSILLEERGDCNFIDKARYAYRASPGSFLIVMNNIAEHEKNPVSFMSGAHFEGKAPIMISKRSGDALLEMLLAEDELVVEIHGLELPTRNSKSRIALVVGYCILAFYMFLLGFHCWQRWCTKRSAERPFLHAGHICNGCQVRPIVGTRYRAKNREDFDFCERCHENYKDGLLEFETVRLDRDIPFQHSWFVYRVLTGVDPPPPEWLPRASIGVEKEEDDGATVESNDDHVPLKMNEAV